MNNLFPYSNWPWFTDLQRPYMVGWAPHSYTMRLNEIVQSKFPTLNTFDKSEMLNALKDVIFNKIDISSINPEYQDAFILGFGLQFWLDEIGQETLDSFLLAVWNVIIKSGGKINSLYAMSEKQLFRSYSHRVNHVNQDVTGNRKSDRNFSEATSQNSKMVNDGSNSSSQEQTTNTTSEGEAETTGNTSGENSSSTDGGNSQTGKTVQAFQDTPQNGLGDVEGLEYLTNATINSNTGTGSNYSTTSGTDSQNSSSKATQSGSGNSTMTGTASGTNKSTTTSDGTGSVAHDEKTNEDTTGNTNTFGTEDVYEVDYDTLMMAGSTLDAVWSLFDECFMEVF